MMYLLIGYMFLFIHRPFEVWPLLGKIQLERVYVLITLISWFFLPQEGLDQKPAHPRVYLLHPGDGTFLSGEPLPGYRLVRSR